MPCSCAASRPAAICRAIAGRFVERQRPRGQAVRQRRPVDELQDERLRVVRRRPRRRWRRCSDDSAPPAPALPAGSGPADRRGRAPAARPSAAPSARRRGRASRRGPDRPRPCRRGRAATRCGSGRRPCLAQRQRSAAAHGAAIEQRMRRAVGPQHLARPPTAAPRRRRTRSSQRTPRGRPAGLQCRLEHRRAHARMRPGRRSPSVHAAVIGVVSQGIAEGCGMSVSCRWAGAWQRFADAAEITGWLALWRDGDGHARDQLFARHPSRAAADGGRGSCSGNGATTPSNRTRSSTSSISGSSAASRSPTRTGPTSSRSPPRRCGGSSSITRGRASPGSAGASSGASRCRTSTAGTRAVQRTAARPRRAALGARHRRSARSTGRRAALLRRPARRGRRGGAEGVGHHGQARLEGRARLAGCTPAVADPGRSG